MTTRKKKVSKAAPRPEPLTAPVEDYLKAIYAFERDGRAAATNDIASRLSIAPASVSSPWSSRVSPMIAMRGGRISEPVPGAR